MQEDVLQKNNIVKIYLCYTDGRNIERKELVELQAKDEKAIYLVGDSKGNLSKPGWFAKAKIVIYTTDGTYTGEGKISIDFSLNKILYTIGRPKKWEFISLRVGDRKRTKLPVEIEFNDGLIINAKIVNLSETGFSICSKENLTNMQTKFPTNCKLEIAEDLLSVKAKYVRQQLILDDYELAGYKIYGFKFLSLLPNQRMILKNFLQKI